MYCNKKGLPLLIVLKSKGPRAVNKAVNAITLSISTLSITTFSITLRKCNTEHNDPKHDDSQCLWWMWLMLSVPFKSITLNDIMLNVTIKFIMLNVRAKDYWQTPPPPKLVSCWWFLISPYFGIRLCQPAQICCKIGRLKAPHLLNKKYINFN